MCKGDSPAKTQAHRFLWARGRSFWSSPMERAVRPEATSVLDERSNWYANAQPIGGPGWNSQRMDFERMFMHCLEMSPMRSGSQSARIDGCWMAIQVTTPQRLQQLWWRGPGLRMEESAM